MSTPFIPITPIPMVISDHSNATVLNVFEQFVVNHNFIHRWQTLINNDFIIAETSFGSGLNFLLTWQLWLQHAPKGARLHVYSSENQPFNADDLSQLYQLWPELKAQTTILLMHYPTLTPGFHSLAFEDGRVNLVMMLGEKQACFQQLLHCGEVGLEKTLRTHCVDAWHLNDPGCTTGVDESHFFKTLALLSSMGTTLVNQHHSHTAYLKSVGFKLSHNQWVLNELIPFHTPAFMKKTPWHIALPQPLNSKKAIILGAGLAGCFVAHLLAKQGWDIVLMDSNSTPSQGASGVAQAILYPKLSAFNSPLAEFMLSAYLHAHRVYSNYLSQHAMGELNGIVQLAYDNKELAAQQTLSYWLDAYPKLGRLVDAEEASVLSGITLELGGMFLPLSGWMDTNALCRYLIDHPGIKWIHNQRIEQFNAEKNTWFVGDYSAETLVLANGYQANQFIQTAELPLEPMSGQLTSIVSDHQINKLKLPLCGEGQLLPEKNGRHLLGATYHHSTEIETAVDDRDNLQKWRGLFPDLLNSSITGNWCGIRAATPDYLPLVGPVPDSMAFQKKFSALASDSKRWLASSGDYYSGLYVFSGFGSRGLTTIPLCAQYLVDLINQAPLSISHRLAQSISPSRFIIKKIIKKSVAKPK